MGISYKDSWDKIQAQYQAGEDGSRSHLKAKAALEIKSIIESTKNTKRLIFATWVLAIFTILLFISTASYTYINYKSYKGSKEQIEALNALTEAVLELPKTEQRLRTLKEAHDRLIEMRKKEMSPQKKAVSGGYSK